MTTLSAPPSRAAVPVEQATGLPEELRVVGMVSDASSSATSAHVHAHSQRPHQPVLFLFVLGYGMSGLVGTVGGFNFHQFVYPGVVAMSVVMTAMFSALSIVWDREFGFLREMLIAPVSRATLVLGKTCGGASVAAVQGTIMLVLAPFVGIHLTPLLVLQMICLELLMAVAMTTFGVFVASRISKMESFQVVMQMLLMPMLFLSGALFPLNGLPAWLAFITRLNPLTYAIAPFRQVIFNAQNMSAVAKAHYSTSVTWFGWPLPMWLELAIVAVFAVVFFVLADRGLARTE